MNMKLLSLLALAQLLALSYANSDAKTAKTFCELLKRLKSLEEHDFNSFTTLEPIQIHTPREIANACECKALFAEHLKQFLRSIKSAGLKIPYSNISDNLRKITHPGVKNGSNCNFTTLNFTTFRPSDFKTLIRDNIAFIQNWNANCKLNHSCPKK